MAHAFVKRLLIIACLFLAPATSAFAQEAAERSRLISFVEDTLSTPDRMIRLNGLQGALSSDVTLTSITIADRDGVWLTIVEPQLVWNRSALLRGRLEIERLAANAIEVVRKPVAGQAAPDMQANEFSIPQLPVALEIGTLEIGTISLAQPVLGFAAQLSIQGNATLNDDGFATVLDVNRLGDVPGSLALDVRYDRATEQFAIDTKLSEPANGIIANALQIPNEPAIDLIIEGEGPIDALTVDIALQANQNDIVAGVVQTSAAENGTRLSFDLGGPLAQIVPPQVAEFLGRNNTLQGRALFGDDGSLLVDQLALDGGALSVTGALARDGDGAFSTAQLAVNLAPRDGDATVVLPGEDPASIANAAINLVFDRSSNPPLQLMLNADDYQSTAARASSVRFDMTGELTDQGQGLSFDGNGQLAGFATQDAKLNAALGELFDIAVSGQWRNGQPLVIENLNLGARDFAATVAATIDGTQIEARGSANVNALSNLAALADINVRGTANLDLAGQFDVLTRAFDVAVNGAANTAFDPATPLDALLSGATLIDGSVRRSVDGTRFERLTIDAPNIIATVDGLLSPDGTDLSLLAKLSDMRLLTPNASGAATLNARLGGVGPGYTINAEIAVPDGTLANLSADDLSILFDGTINGADVDGALSADGRLGTNAFVLDGDVAAASGSVRLDDFALGLGPNTITGSVARDPDGLLAGRLAVNAPDLQPLAALALQQVTGALTGTIELAPIGASQRVTVQSNASGIDYGGVSIGGAVLDMRIDDALAAPRFAGTVTAQSITAPGVTLASAQATLDGTSQSTNFQLTVDGVASAAAAQIAPANLTASGSFNGAQGLLNLQQFAVTNSQDIAISGGGTLATRTNALNMRVSGQAQFDIAEPFLATRGTQVDGLARFEATIGGTTSAPLINGLLSVADGNVTDPLANLRLTNINLLAGLNGDQISINRMNARIGERGQLTVGGTVNIAANMPAALQVGLRGIPYSDGQTFSTLLNGDLTLNGPLAGQPVLAGRVDLARTEITVPESFSASANLLDVDHLRPDQQTSTTLQRIEQTRPADSGSSGGGIALNLVVNAPSQIFVRGRGLDAELGGALTLRGTTADVIPQGQFDLRRGRLEILGQRLDFEQGSIRLVGDLDPFLNFRVASDVGDTTVFITLTGRAADLQFSFTSAPELPQDEVVALLLFGRSVSELSPVQILRLASAISELTGEDALNLVGVSRDLLGIDDLDIVDDGQGNAAVRAGTYINERVYLGFEAGSETEASINLDITESLTARGSVSTDGESKLGVFFERDY